MALEDIIDPEIVEELRRRYPMPPAPQPNSPQPVPPGLSPMPPAPMPRPAAPRMPYGPPDLREPAMPAMPPAPMPNAAIGATPPPAMPPAPMPAAQPPNRSQQYSDLLKLEPQHSQFKPDQMPFWKKALGLAFAGAGGFGTHDGTTYQLAQQVLNGPQAAADKKYNAAEEDWKSKLGAVGAEAGLDEKSAATQKDIASADEAHARADSLRNPKSEKEVSLAQQHADAVTAAIQAGRDPAKDPVVQQYADAITSLQKPGAPPHPSTKEDLQRQLVDAETKGDKVTAKKLQQQLKDIDPLGENRLAVTIQGQTNTQNARDDKAAADAVKATRQEIRDHDKAYVKPADDVEKSYQMMNNAYNDYKTAAAQGKQLPTGAESMLALSTHLSTTFGNVKGARVTKDMIEHHLGARSISDSALAAFQKLTNGDVLSPDQWDAFHKLIGESRQISWQTAAKEANRKNIPVDFLPNDLSNLKDTGKGGQGGDSSKIQIHRDANGRIVGVE